MRVKFISMLFKYLNKNFDKVVFDKDTMFWFKNEKIVAVLDEGRIEVLFDILKEGVLPW